MHTSVPHRRRLLGLATVIAIAASVVVATGTLPAQAGTAIAATQDDVIAPKPYQPSQADGSASLLSAVPEDPLGLVPYPAETRRYTSGTDVFEVWECPDDGAVPTTAARFVADAEAEMSPYFAWLSDGMYDPKFIVGGAVPPGQSCSQWARTQTAGSADAAIFLVNSTAGLAGPGVSCIGYESTCPTTYPENVREAFIGVAGDNWPSTLAHEIGHTLSWPHSSTDGGETNNAIDVMSGNFGTWTVGSTTWWGTLADPYSTTAFNRYQAGWIDPSDVIVWNGSDTQLNLNDLASGGKQMLVIDGGPSFFTLDTRTASSLDPIPSVWEGVEVYEVSRCSTCWGVSGDVTAVPSTVFASGALSAYSQPLDHVLSAKGSVQLANAAVTVVQVNGNAFTLEIENTGFVDVPPADTFFADIEWLAAEGITRGCNPPANTRFCPGSFVTRGQMAAFLVRAMSYTSTGGGNLFVDDNTSIFETDIDRLATAGVTKGCNPPANSEFCPDSKVTRGQMAAFLTRAMSYTNTGGGNLFVDDNTSIFETDIDRLATAGVTKGCNPPANTRFCPNSYVTRAQMAAFLHRALG